MEMSDYVRFVLALVFVLALIGLFSWLAKRYGLGGRIKTVGGKGKRIKIVEITAIDAKRRVVLLRRDGTEHLVLLGGGNDVVIERGIPANSLSDPPPAENASAARDLAEGPA